MAGFPPVCPVVEASWTGTKSRCQVCHIIHASLVPIDIIIQQMVSVVMTLWRKHSKQHERSFIKQYCIHQSASERRLGKREREVGRTKEVSGYGGC